MSADEQPAPGAAGAAPPGRPGAGKDKASPGDAGAAAAAGDVQSSGEGESTGEGEAGEQQDRPQDAWSARRDLWDHSPRTMKVGDDARFGGSFVGRDQHGVSGGRVAGDVIMGSKTEIHYRFGFSGSAGHTSGEIPRATLDRLAPYFVAAEPAFTALVERLREERVLVLSGPDFSGRRTAALMLLHRLGLTPVRTLVRNTDPASLGTLGGSTGADSEEPGARGYLLCDLVTRRDRPLREAHLLAARERLAKDDAYLVITVGPVAALDGVLATHWKSPPAHEVLAAHLKVLAGPERAGDLLALPATTEFLAHGHQLREVGRFAEVLRQYADGALEEAAVSEFSLTTLEDQVQEWFEEDETTVQLRDKAFLIALASFDGGPYALTAELSDLLYAFLLRTENPGLHPAVPVFGTHIGKRLQLARAHRYDEDETTEWGPVTQSKAAFTDARTALVLLRELWTGHPSARPALVAWLQRLTEDGRPLVRTRAASTVAVLARTDLPSAMALVIEPWASSNRYRRRLVAVNALALTYFLDTPNVPRILDDWCDSGEPGLSWVAIRTHALIGHERPDETLKALRAAARRLRENATDGEGTDAELAGELAESVALLLLSSARERVLRELLRTLHDDKAVKELALGGFIGACDHTERDEPAGVPLILGWYAQDPPDGAAPEPAGTARQNIAALWRAALGTMAFTRDALDVLRDWVLVADRNTAAEWALASLLPELTTTELERQRISHLLRTMPGEDGSPPPPVTVRLHTVLPPEIR
ncbi:hypothetical protein [Streptomyces sp. NPDC058297]|uniref:hypothetical protein n=1 Tax=Streptomyces sp. NPDC058297 TaxID=3346433 RepID=UPI0036E935E1